MRSYFEILTELRDMISNDPIPSLMKDTALNLLERLFGLLWAYSD